MAFKVRFTAENTQEFGDDDVYDFLASGVLSIRYATPGQWAEYHAPGQWELVSARSGHGPGDTAGEVPGGLLVDDD